MNEWNVVFIFCDTEKTENEGQKHFYEWNEP